MVDDTIKEDGKGMVKDDDGNECMFFEIKDGKCPGKEDAPAAEEGQELDSAPSDVEMKLNAQAAEIAGLKAVIDELVQKQNAAEQKVLAQKEQADFEAFRTKLNAANRVEDIAKQHYEGFKQNGWKYIDEHQDAFKLEAPRMKAMGVPGSDGPASSKLEQAREGLRKTLATPTKRLGK
jgi:hypothetical protein